VAILFLQPPQRGRKADADHVEGGKHKGGGIQRALEYEAALDIEVTWQHQQQPQCWPAIRGRPVISARDALANSFHGKRNPENLGREGGRTQKEAPAIIMRQRRRNAALLGALVALGSTWKRTSFQ